MTLLLVVEILATVTSLGFMILLVRQHIGCWPLAIVSGILSIYLFIQTKLYSEAILYGYYTIIAIYGWWRWSTPSHDQSISYWKTYLHVWAIGLGAVCSVLLGAFFYNYTDAAQPWIDAPTTVFSVIASVLEARKIIEGWLYWVVINAVTIGLYMSQSLYIYAVLMFVALIISVVGFLEWRKKILV